MSASGTAAESNINVAHMIDLAIGTPEVGIVDFNMLQAVLHILAQQMGVLDKAVTLRGLLASPQLVPTLMESGHTIAVKEYELKTDDLQAAAAAGAGPNPVLQDTMLIVDRVKKNPAQVAASTQAAAKKGKDAATAIAAGIMVERSVGVDGYRTYGTGGGAIVAGGVATTGVGGGGGAATGVDGGGVAAAGVGGGGVAAAGVGGGGVAAAGVGGGGMGTAGVGPGGVGPGGVTGGPGGFGTDTNALAAAVQELYPRVYECEGGINNLNAIVEDLINANPDFKRVKSVGIELKSVGTSTAGYSFASAGVGIDGASGGQGGGGWGVAGGWGAGGGQGGPGQGGPGWGPGGPGQGGPGWGPGGPGGPGSGPGGPGQGGPGWGPGGPGQEGAGWGPGGPGQGGGGWGPGGPGGPAGPGGPGGPGGAGWGPGGQGGPGGAGWGPGGHGGPGQGGPGQDGAGWGPSGQGGPGQGGAGWGPGGQGGPGQGGPGQGGAGWGPGGQGGPGQGGPGQGGAGWGPGGQGGPGQGGAGWGPGGQGGPGQGGAGQGGAGWGPGGQGGPGQGGPGQGGAGWGPGGQGGPGQGGAGWGPGGPGGQGRPGAGIPSGGPPPLNIPSGTLKPTLKPGEAPNYDTIVEIYNQMNELQNLIKAVNDNNSATRQFDLENIWQRIYALEKIIQNCCENASMGDERILEHINSAVMDQVTKQEMGVRNTMDGRLSKIFDTIDGDKSKRDDVLNNIIKQVELLKVIKMDREDLTELLAEKADNQALARKVSYDKFDLACEDFAGGLEHAIEKLTFQETLWQQALDDVQREMTMKLDKVDLEPVKEYFFNKLKALQENIKHLADMRRDVEAAGAKKRLLRDVNCITCDANVVMNMEAPRICPVERLPPHISMKPYITYELDQMRKRSREAKSGQHRNMHDWEAMQKGARKAQSAKVSKTDKGDHPCYRYCGGMHTVTTPAQRVARAGHFMKQWGPEVYPIPSQLAAGDDGKMYKLSVQKKEEAKAAKTEPPKQKPSLIKIGPVINDCRCFEEPEAKK